MIILLFRHSNCKICEWLNSGTSRVLCKFIHVFFMHCSNHESDSHDHVITLIPAGISNYTYRNAWDEIIYPFPNFNGAVVHVWEWMINLIPHHDDVIKWKHSALLAICVGNSAVTGEFPAQRPVTRSFGAFFHLRLYKRLSKQWWNWWFETPSRLLSRHCNALLAWHWLSTLGLKLQMILGMYCNEC